MREEKCCAGCKRFTGDETYHIPECPFYEESMSRMYDEACEELKLLKDKYRWRNVSEELPQVNEEHYWILTKSDDNRLDVISILNGYDKDVVKFLLKNHVEWKPID